MCLPLSLIVNMVVDMELEAAKFAVLELSNQKEAIEKELKSLYEVLETVRKNPVQIPSSATGQNSPVKNPRSQRLN